MPKECWRNASKIYLDPTKKPFLWFKVENGAIKIIKESNFEIDSQKTIPVLIQENSDRIDELLQASIQMTVDVVRKNPNHFYLVGYSGGKDSDLTYYVWNEALKELDFEVDYVINFANTSNDTADTYRKVKSLGVDKLRILNPSVGFYKWIAKVKNYKIPTVLTRNCCSTYKEGQLFKEYDTNRPTIQVLGLRKNESTKRANYQVIMDGDFYMNILGKNTLPKNWVVFAPVIDWTDVDVWLWLLRDNIQFNKQYKYGFSRCGCLVCPYQTNYTDLLIQEYYPNIWNRWVSVLKKSYDTNHIKENFKWSLDEYIGKGMWKEGKSKEQMLIHCSPTKERVQELANIKGISTTMANKFFKKKCSTCGKKLNPSEIAMFFKLNGRYEDVPEDNRPIQCRKCYCKSSGITAKDYNQMAYRFTDEGCNLF